MSRNTLAVEALEHAAREDSRPATLADLQRFADRFTTLADDAAMDTAWRR